MFSIFFLQLIYSVIVKLVKIMEFHGPHGRICIWRKKLT